MVDVPGTESETYTIFHTVYRSIKGNRAALLEVPVAGTPTSTHSYDLRPSSLCMQHETCRPTRVGSVRRTTALRETYDTTTSFHMSLTTVLPGTSTITCMNSTAGMCIP